MYSEPATPDTIEPDEATHAHEPEGEHVHLPPSSIWPLTCAAGIALGGLGLVTTYPIAIAGVILMVIAIVYWVQELRHERQYPH